MYLRSKTARTQILERVKLEYNQGLGLCGIESWQLKMHACLELSAVWNLSYKSNPGSDVGGCRIRSN